MAKADKKKSAKKVKAKKKRKETEVEAEDIEGTVEPEEEEEEEDSDTPTSKYAGEKQPTWVTEPPEDADGVTVESERGFRIHVWPNEGKAGRVMVTGKDWEDGEGLHPGKVIKMNGEDLAELLTGVLQEVFGHSLALNWEVEDE